MNLKSVIVFTILLWKISVFAQNFTTIKINASTPVKDQAQSSTCWSFGTLSFIESELLRKGKGEFDLSEMYVSRKAYLAKASNYIRMQGYCFLTAGGQPHDVLNVIRKYGIVQESDFSGLINNYSRHNHTQLDTCAQAIINEYVESTTDNLSAVLQQRIDSLLDAQLGKTPANVMYHGKQYTPQQFATQILDFNPDDYIEITSYTHHPYYKPFALETRYNWAMEQYMNVPLSEFMQIIDHALLNGYTVVFNGDVSSTFDFWEGTGNEEYSSQQATQELRQQMFENHTSKVDHVMHITGLVKNKKGLTYYYTKNSWGAINKYKGFVYLSRAYLQLKCVSVLVHKSAIPKVIAEKFIK